jgi:ABC-type ATPase involved in cell division
VSDGSVILCSLSNYSLLDQAQEELKSFQEAAIILVSSMKTETYHQQRIPTLRQSVGLILTDSELLLILQSLLNVGYGRN